MIIWNLKLFFFFLPELLLDSLFKPGVKLNPEHKSKYNHLLAYAASVAEVYKKNQRKSMNRDEFKPTMQVRYLYFVSKSYVLKFFFIFRL